MTSCELYNAAVYFCRTQADTLASIPRLSKKPTESLVLRLNGAFHKRGTGSKAQYQSMAMFTAVVA